MYGDDENEDHRGDIVNYALMSNIDVEPSYFENACTNDLWFKAMEDEIHSIEKNETWELVVNGSTRPSTIVMALLRGTKQGSLPRDLKKKIALIMRKSLHQ